MDKTTQQPSELGSNRQTLGGQTLGAQTLGGQTLGAQTLGGALPSGPKLELSALGRARANIVLAFRRLDQRLRGDSEPIEGADHAPRALGPTLMTGDGSSPDHAKTLESDQSFYFGFIVVILGLISGLATFLVLSGLTPLVPSAGIVTTVVYINAALIIAMIVVIGRHLRGLIRQWRERVPGARLHGRIVVLFSIIAALPGLLLAIGATTTFSRTLDGIFNRETRAIVENSLDVANAYLQEHGRVINADIVNMAKDLDAAAIQALADPLLLKSLLLAQSGLRNLSAAYVIDAEGRAISASVDEDRIAYIAPQRAIIVTAMQGLEVPVLLQANSNRVAAVARLANYPGRALYIVRAVDSNVVGHLRRTQAGVAQYEQFRQATGRFKLAHAVMYSALWLTALLAAVWTGLWFAGRFVAPISRLIAGAQAVSRGNLTVQLPVYRGEGDLRRLSQTFNNMTRQIERQQNQLEATNGQLSERRRFMEAVLSGVSAGVIGLDGEARVTLVNRSSERLLGVTEANLIGRRILDTIPEFAPVIAGTDDAGRKKGQHEISLTVQGSERTFAVKMTRETQTASGEVPTDATSTDGAVITLDDITELVSAQRTSAWADVARRIAHEIKNPLTPIQLSAERLRRKYSHVITEDREVFDKCTETIIRQVGDVARMVDEFSSFARMPKAEMAPMDLRDAVRDTVTMYQMGATGGVAVSMTLPDAQLPIIGDRRLLSQGLTNLVKNATESVQAVIDSKDKPADFKGRVDAILTAGVDTVTIEVIDNGLGLPKQGRQRLLEPYVTTKGAKGTGLGLSIVQKIVEQHGGALQLEDAPPLPHRPRGALVRISLPTRALTAEELTLLGRVATENSLSAARAEAQKRDRIPERSAS